MKSRAAENNSMETHYRGAKLQSNQEKFLTPIVGGAGYIFPRVLQKK